MDLDPELARNTYDQLSRLEMECHQMFKKTWYFYIWCWV